VSKLADIDDEEYEELFDNINANYASHILEEMSYDNAVDIHNTAGSIFFIM
jgi:magnesium transporter